MRDKKSHPTTVAHHSFCLSSVVFQNLTAAPSTMTSKFFVLLLAFNDVSNSRGHRSEQERVCLLIERSRKSARFLTQGPENVTMGAFLPLTLGSQQITDKSRQELPLLHIDLFSIYDHFNWCICFLTRLLLLSFF